MQSTEGVDYRKFLKPGEGSLETVTGSKAHTSGSSSQTAAVHGEHSSEKNKYKDASARSVALGEKAFVGMLYLVSVLSLNDSKCLLCFYRNSFP